MLFNWERFEPFKDCKNKQDLQDFYLALKIKLFCNKHPELREMQHHYELLVKA